MAADLLLAAFFVCLKKEFMKLKMANILGSLTRLSRKAIFRAAKMRTMPLLLRKSFVFLDKFS